MRFCTARRRPSVLVAIGASVLVAACGASPTDTPSRAEGGGGLQAVYAAVEGKTGQERFDVLLEMAREEAAKGPFGFYHSGTFTAEVEAFERLTGLEVGDFEATSERVAERVSNEHQAGRVGSSVAMASPEELITLRGSGAVEQLRSPVLDTVGDDFQGDGWVSPLAIMEMPTYNSDKVQRADLPTSWEDFFTNFDGRIGIELTDWRWYGAIVENYFVAQRGMTEQQAIDLITKGLRGASTVDGHTLSANLLASGQYDYVPNLYAHYVPALAGEGAPISYDGLAADMPPFFTVVAVGLTAGSTHPASGLLFLEFLMSAECQDIIGSRDYIAPASTYSGRTLLDDFPNAIPERVQPGPGEDLSDVQERWTARFDELLRNAGTSKIEGSG